MSRPPRYAPSAEVGVKLPSLSQRELTPPQESAPTLLYPQSMRTEIAQIVDHMFSKFKDSGRAQLWHTFTDAIREDMIDACVRLWRFFGSSRELLFSRASKIFSRRAAEYFRGRDLWIVR